jgi:hypothetical protein
VPIVRMAGARTVRRIRMMTSMRQPRRTACELVPAATPGTIPAVPIIASLRLITEGSVRLSQSHNKV